MTNYLQLKKAELYGMALRFKWGESGTSGGD
jgi:hypothetical protein